MIDTTHLNDIHVLACTLYGEARSEPTEGILAVACVLRNKAAGGYRAACLGLPVWQDAPLEEPNRDGKPITTNHGKLAKLVAELKVGPVTDARYKECAWIATGVINGWVRDVTEGADAYHAAGLMPRPEWAKAIHPYKQCGRTVLYRRQGVAA